MFLTIIAFAVASALLYAFYLRGLLIARFPEWKSFCDRVDVLAYTLWRGSRTILAARLLSLSSVALGLHDAVASSSFNSLDWTPLTNRLLAAVPADLRGLVIAAVLAGIGMFFEWLRRATTAALPSKPE
jgi:hypothetical protein